MEPTTATSDLAKRTCLVMGRSLLTTKGLDYPVLLVNVQPYPLELVKGTLLGAASAVAEKMDAKPIDFTDNGEATCHSAQASEALICASLDSSPNMG